MSLATKTPAIVDCATNKIDWPDGFRDMHLVGDTLKITHSKLPNLDEGTIGKTREPYEVMSQSINFDNRTARMVLSRSYFNRPWFIAPNGTPDYLSASEDQRQFGFWADADDDQMSNGDKGYTIQ